MLGVVVKRLLRALSWGSRPDRNTLPDRNIELGTGQFLSQIWVNPSFVVPEGTIYVGLERVYPVGIKNKKGITVEECLSVLTSSLSLPSRKDFAPRPKNGHVYILSVAITQMTPGVWWLRLFLWAESWLSLIGLLGIGHAWVQVEGVLTESGSSYRIMQFVERQRKTDNFLGSYAKIDSGPTLVKEMLADIGHRILQELHAGLCLDRVNHRPLSREDPWLES